MKWTAYLLSFFFFLSAPVLAFGAVINEVMTDPVGTDTGQEWIEIYNSSDATQDLSGWEVYPDGIGYFTFPAGFSLASHDFAVVYLRASGMPTAHALYHSSATGNMGNTSGSAALFSGEPRSKDTLKSFVEWGKAGQTWEGTAQDIGLWTKGTFVDLTGAIEGNSLGLKSDGDAAAGAASWKIYASSTPGISNVVIAQTSTSSLQDAQTETPSSTASASPPPSSSSSSHVYSAPTTFPEFHVYAGEDRDSVAGALVDFIGYATGSKKEPLENARFWWNFGDGENREGRAVTHSFAIPGEYTVGLHISSDIYAASDYLTVRVVSNQLVVVDVTKGEDGFLRLHNKGDSEVDIGGWIIEDAMGKRFVVPMKTKVAKAAHVAFSNKVTGLFKEAEELLTLYYPNGARALEWRREAQAALPVIATSTVRSDIPIHRQVELSKTSSSPSSGAYMTATSTHLSAVPDNTMASVSLAPRFFFIGALILSFLGAVSFLFFKGSF